MGNLITYYTCVTNCKDEIKCPFREDGVKYVLYTDMPGFYPGWDQVLILNNPEGLSKRMMARKVKTLGPIDDSEYHVWVDGNVRLLRPIIDYIGLLPISGNVASRKHPLRNCIYEEATAIKQYQFDDRIKVNNTVDFLKSEGYPENNGLCETNIVIFKNNDASKEFRKQWWNRLLMGSQRDQLSFNYVAWKLGQEISIIPDEWVYKEHHLKPTTNTQ